MECFFFVPLSLSLFLLHFVIFLKRDSQFSEDCSPVYCEIGRNCPQMRERFKPKDMLINLRCMRRGRQCMSPGSLGMRRGHCV